MMNIDRREASTPEGSVSYLTAGDGPVLVLVHGTGGTAESNWAHLIPELAASHRIIAPDLPGSGETDLGPTPLHLDRLGRAVVAAIEAEDARDIRIVGFSLGALVAVQATALVPDRIESAVLIGGWLDADPRLVVQMGLWQHLIARDPDAAASLLTLTGFSPRFLSGLNLTNLRASISETAATLPVGMVAQSELDTRADIRDIAAGLRLPVTVAGMTDDHMVPIEGPRALAAAIPGSEFVELTSGHLVIYELPDHISALIRGTGRNTTKE